MEIAQQISSTAVDCLIRAYECSKMGCQIFVQAKSRCPCAMLSDSDEKYIPQTTKNTKTTKTTKSKNTSSGTSLQNQDKNKGIKKTKEEEGEKDVNKPEGFPRTKANIGRERPRFTFAGLSSSTGGETVHDCDPSLCVCCPEGGSTPEEKRERIQKNIKEITKSRPKYAKGSVVALTFGHLQLIQDLDYLEKENASEVKKYIMRCLTHMSPPNNPLISSLSQERAPLSLSFYHALGTELTSLKAGDDINHFCETWTLIDPQGSND